MLPKTSKKYIASSILNARRRKKEPRSRWDIDSDDPMYDETYQEVGPSSDADVLNINNDDLFHFIQVLIFESRE